MNQLKKHCPFQKRSYLRILLYNFHSAYTILLYCILRPTRWTGWITWSEPVTRELESESLSFSHQLYWHMYWKWIVVWNSCWNSSDFVFQLLQTKLEADNRIFNWFVNILASQLLSWLELTGVGHGQSE